MKDQISESICLSMEPEELSVFFPMLQNGFMLKIQTGYSIKDIICKYLCVRTEYIEDRIKIAFLDGKPVDDIGKAIVRDGSVVALSAAMPGLVGTTFRMGGHLASFRSSITHHENEAQPIPVQEQGIAVFKLFNLLVKELGPLFLEKGIWVKKDELKDVIELPEPSRYEKSDIILLKITRNSPDGRKI